MKTILALFSLFVASETLAQSSAQNLSMMAMTNACKGCDLSNSQLVGVDFSGKDLTLANFSGSVADAANFSGAELMRVLLTGGSFKSANFDGAKILVESRIASSSAGGRVFQKGIDFRSATFKNAEVNIDVSESIFDGANFSGAKTLSINSSDCGYRSILSLALDEALGTTSGTKESRGKPSSFRGISVLTAINQWNSSRGNVFCSRGGNVSNAKFDNSNFDRPLGGFVVVDGDLTGSSFLRAGLQMSAFTNSNLTGADFTYANLTDANFEGANLTSVNFTEANLTDANFEGANLTSVNFTGANLEGANLAGAILCETIDPKGTMLYFGCE